ncbi:MAG: TRAP transporter large permease [Alphaproteobacteria bacterium]|jgi:TRAP-type transport system large permease protein|nr:TRAP transporter large permease [Alphaproteobacteria bacterium]MBU1551623.1 TRAP transporter large permease [Alphaproteobacteria bacterium]MBU2337358.1 TRAP transporter large permease [Alphaproteobacteria bacterium]MBU2388101.1 TRAP transporter large permease [Alphaproteobacteria bacterium]
MLAIVGILFVALLLLGVPVGMILIMVSLVYVLLEPAVLDMIFAQRLLIGTQSFPLIAVPLFILTGELMNISGISRRVMSFASLLTRHFWGRMAMTNVALSTLLAGMSGSSNGDAAMQAKIMVPEMLKRGYPRGYSVALTAVTSLIAPMIPPGIGLILFGFVTNVSIGELFAGAIIPGLMLAALLIVQVWFTARHKQWEPPDEGLAETPIGGAFVAALPAILLPVLIIVGIRAGIFTPAEAASVAVVYTGLCVAAYREADWRQILAALRSTVVSTSAILLILAASSAFSWILTFEQVPQTVAAAMLGWTNNAGLMLLLVSLLLLLAGAFIDGTALILILGPIFLPVVTALGVDPVHYGVIFVLMAHLGGITPPVGTIMFATCTITRTPLSEFMRAILPFLCSYTLLALVIIFVPWFSLVLTGR